MKKGILFIGAMILIYSSVFSQLTAGDIMIIGVRTDATDNFTFVALANISAGEQINFTDNGVLSSGAIRGGESTVLYTVPAGGLVPGDVVSQLGNSVDFGPPLSAMSSSGDQVIAYTGASVSPTFIAGAQTNSTLWQTGSDDSNQSDLPTGLTNGLDAVAVGAGTGVESEIDNSEYTGTRDLAGRTKAQMLAILSDSNNWTGNNSPIALNTTNFTGVLPIQLLSFSVTAKENKIILNWKTATELNNDFMAIEHSTNGRDFSEIGRVQGNGTTNETQSYTFTDTKPAKGLNYYRLRQVDFDGHTEIHKVVSVLLYGNDEGIRIAPTEVQDEVMLYLPEASEAMATIHIYDMSGRLWKTSTLEAGKIETSFNLSQLVAGQYVLQLVGEVQVSTVRFNKL